MSGLAGGTESAGEAARCCACLSWYVKTVLHELQAPCWPECGGGDADPDISILQVLVELHCLVYKCEDKYNMWLCNACLLRARSSYQFQLLCRESQRHLTTERMLIDSTSIKIEDEIKNIKNLKIKEKSTRKTKRLPKGTNKAQEQLYGSDLWQPASCSDCDTKFSNVPNLLTHRRNEHTSRFQCLHCGVGLTTSRGLRLHLRSHTGSRPEVCSTCGATFSDPRTLRMHEKRHAGTLPHECTTCGRQFPARIPLERHRTTHHAVDTIYKSCRS